MGATLALTLTGETGETTGEKGEKKWREMREIRRAVISTFLSVFFLSLFLFRCVLGTSWVVDVDEDEEGAGRLGVGIGPLVSLLLSSY